MIAYYVHDLNPVILEITENIKLRWYGMAYLMAFVLGYLLLKWLANRQKWVLPGKEVGDFIAGAAIFGVFLGGRIGNVLIYQRDEFFADPLMLFKVWQGGMASHGGILGLMIYTFYYARKKKVSWTGIGDGLCVVAPIGLFLGRIANFINGELYGRIDRSFAWAMKFPNALFDGGSVDAKTQEVLRQPSFENQSLWKAYNDAVVADNGGTFAQQAQQGGGEHEKLNAAIRDNDAVKQVVAQYLEPRYPSQLFEAATEGLALFLILLIVRLKFPKLAHGVLTGLFFIFYAIFRIAMEQFREPEIGNLNVLGLEVTMGQFLSIFMIFIGAGFIALAKKRVGKASIFNHGGL